MVVENEDYLVSLVLVVPESEVNFEVGNINVEVDFSEDFRCKGIGMMTYYSKPVRTLRSLFKFWLILVGLTQESQEIKVDLYHSIPDASSVKQINITITPPELQVYKAYFNLEVQLFGIRYLMHYYFYSSWVLGSLVIFLLELLATAWNYVSFSKASAPKETPKPPVEWIVPNTNNNSELVPKDFSHLLKPKPLPFYKRIFKKNN